MSRPAAREKRYLVLAEGKALDPHYGKTARGAILYGPHPVTAVVDSENAGADLEGVPIVGSVEEGLTLEPQPNTALVGVAVAGGRLPSEWRSLLVSVLEAGLDLESGMHEFLSEDPELAEIARSHGAEIRDLRKPPVDLSVSTGENLRHEATVVLTVGSDCAIGKKSVAIELDREARARGVRSVFVPTGQTGIAIAGWGIAVDAVVADFLAGAAERLVLEGAKRGDVLFVEGQGSIVHPQFSGVALGLYHGSAPHLLVLCHMARETEIDGCPGHPIPPLAELVELHERMSLPARPAQVAALALNTHRLAEHEARRAIAEAEEETGLPADDPVRFGPVRLLEALLERFPSGIRAS
jgi:D-glutamate N-acetyltransferase